MMPPPHTRFLLLLVLLISVAQGKELSLVLRNEIDESVSVFWEDRNGEGKRVLQGEVAGNGGEIFLKAFAGHIFSYDHGGERHFIKAPSGHEDFFFVLLGTKKEVPVLCTTTADGGQLTNQKLRILVKPYWSPRGAGHFLDLVRAGYYNGVALNRVVPRFLTQFGISPDYKMRSDFRTRTIRDDPKPEDPEVPFKPGMLSYAGSGPNSRTTEVFVVMPETDQKQLDYFGINPWETPFAIVDGELGETPVPKWFSYGDMPPSGEGPESQKIYQADGYEYLAREFPKIDFIEQCVIEISAARTEEEL